MHGAEHDTEDGEVDVPTIKSAEKRLRQSEKRRNHNKSVRSRIRTETRKLMEAESAEEAEERLQELYALLDRAAAKDVIHENKAAREKSRLARHVEELKA
jgi:small subunit ribosomal protein S20